MNKFTPLTSAALASVLALAVTSAGAAGMSGSDQLSQDQQQQFQKLDTNGDGQISQDEANANQQLADKFSTVDANHDNAIDKGEFSQFEVPQDQGSSQGQ